MSTEQDTSDDSEQQASMVDDQTPDPSEITDEELESQDWTLGGDADEEIVECFGMQWRMVEPMEQSQVDTLVTPQGGGDVMREWCETIIQAPAITDDRWEEMKPKERTLLTDKCMTFFGFDDFVDQEAMMEAVQSGDLQEAMQEARDAENRGGN